MMRKFFMALEFVTAIGLIAAALTTGAFVPQVIKIWKTRKTNDISLAMFIAFSAGIFMWLVYGLMINSAPVIIANLVTFVLAIVILLFKLKYK